ncbi:sulfurtransferase complex subunit TusB [Buchnera aphidicola (Formosaphis micheliae)]|uniref:sulfurtransferase complex subunit TusB n=1 Tax=Buchnera aphidicola TaxID=9 RepID=UPI0031B7F8CE
MLHTLMNSPFHSNMKLLFNLLNKSDDLLALQDGVIISTINNIFLKKILKISVNLYVLKEDVEARGLIKHVSNEFKLINYRYFVFLTEKNKQQMNW